MSGHACDPYLVIICFSLVILAGESASPQLKCPFNYIYQVGDGGSDIGNAIRTIPFGPLLPAARLPYGKTFPGRPTGRWSDGRLIIDFAVPVFGIKPITPYLDRSPTTDTSVMFNVEGSPVLNTSFYAKKGIILPPYVAPFNIQLDWVRQYRGRFKGATDFRNRLADSLFILTDYEGNDIRYPLLQGRSIEEIQNDYVPLVIETIIKDAREVIEAGANRILINGNVPLGCFPSILSAFQSIKDPSAYDDLGCLKSVNNLVVFKNNILQTAVESLKLEFPNVTIIYGDFYTLIQSLLQQATVFGFDNNTLLKACCGTGGKYNYNKIRFCGTIGVPVCSNVTNYIHWDGINLTEEANYKLSQIRVIDIYVPDSIQLKV